MAPPSTNRAGGARPGAIWRGGVRHLSGGNRVGVAAGHTADAAGLPFRIYFPLEPNRGEGAARAPWVRYFANLFEGYYFVVTSGAGTLWRERFAAERGCASLYFRETVRSLDEAAAVKRAEAGGLRNCAERVAASRAGDRAERLRAEAEPSDDVPEPTAFQVFAAYLFLAIHWSVRLTLRAIGQSLDALSTLTRRADSVLPVFNALPPEAVEVPLAALDRLTRAEVARHPDVQSLRRQLLAARRSNPDGRTVVFSHGLTGSGCESAWQCAEWASHGHIVLCPQHCDGSSGCAERRPNREITVGRRGAEPQGERAKVLYRFTPLKTERGCTSARVGQWREARTAERAAELWGCLKWVREVLLTEENVGSSGETASEPVKIVLSGFSYGVPTALLCAYRHAAADRSVEVAGLLAIDGWLSIPLADGDWYQPREVFADPQALNFPIRFLASHEFALTQGLFTAVRDLVAARDRGEPVWVLPTSTHFDLCEALIYVGEGRPAFGLLAPVLRAVLSGIRFGGWAKVKVAELLGKKGENMNDKAEKKQDTEFATLAKTHATAEAAKASALSAADRAKMLTPLRDGVACETGGDLDTLPTKFNLSAGSGGVTEAAYNSLTAAWRALPVVERMDGVMQPRALERRKEAFYTAQKLCVEFLAEL